ncbi:Malectin [Gracilaria domingensis]|nr:Malectin [Gracilaria domingensis]
MLLARSARACSRALLKRRPRRARPRDRLASRQRSPSAAACELVSASFRSLIAVMRASFRWAPVLFALAVALLSVAGAQQLVLSVDAGGGNDTPDQNRLGNPRTFGTVVPISGVDQDQYAFYSKHRYGKDFSYIFSLAPAVAYDIKFYIAEPYNPNCNAGSRVYSIYAYDSVAGVASGKSLENLDVFAMAGCRTAYQYEMTGIVLDQGQLRIQFVSSAENAMISGFDITTSDTSFSPSPSPSKQLVTSTDMVSINCGNDPNDQNLPNTKIGSVPNSATVVGTANVPEDFYRKTRAGTDFTYKFFLSAGTYDITLGFVESYNKYCANNWRIFNVFVNGVKFLDRYDPYVQSGGCYTGVEESLLGQVTDGSAPLTIRFDSVQRNAAVAYIGISPAGGVVSPSSSPVSSPMPSAQPSTVPSTVPSPDPSADPSAAPSADPSPSGVPPPSPSPNTGTTDSATVNAGATGDVNVAGTTKYSSGATFTATSDIGANIFKTGRSGTDFTYSFDLTPGAYDIIIGFAEYQNSFCTEPGQRVFNVYVNDEIQVESLDLSVSGCFTGVQEGVTSSVGVVDTQPITIRFEAIIGEAIVSYIKISPAADVCIPASNSGGLAPGEDHAAHAVPGSYPPQFSANSPKSYVDSNGDGFAAVQIDGSGSHSHFFDAANNIIGVITEYKWSLVETGEVISTKESFWYSFPLGTTRLKLSVIDNSCTTDEAETTVTVTGAMQPGQYCYYYSGLSEMLIGGDPVAQAPYPKFAAVSTSLNLGFPSFSFDDTLFVARCFFFLEVDADTEVTTVGATTGGTGDVRIYKGTDLLVDSKAADSMETSLAVGLTSFEVIYERTTTTGTPQLQFKVNNTIPASGKVFHDRTTVVPILASLTPSEGADSGGTSVKVTGGYTNEHKSVSVLRRITTWNWHGRY